VTQENKVLKESHGTKPTMSCNQATLLKTVLQHYQKSEIDTLAYTVGFSYINAFLTHVAHSPDQQRFVYTAFLIHCFHHEWDKSRENAASVTGVLCKMSVHVRLLRQVGIGVISFSDS